MTTYFEVPNEIYTIAQDLIPEHHPHLQDAAIKFIYRAEAWNSQGNITSVGVSRPSEKSKVAFDHDFDFLVEIAEDTYSDMSAERREALLDFALCHCKHVEEKGYRIAHPPISSTKR